ncbi:MAG: hypothetical protein QXK78_02520 [Candidatus Bathyarchaeia archaeon]
MLSWINLAHDAHQLLQAFYWVMMDVSNSLEEAMDKADGGVKLHLMLASKRCNLIIEHIKIAIEGVELNPDKKPNREKLESILGTLSIETLENIKSTIKKLINDLASSGNCNPSWLSTKLMEIANIICIASGLLRAFSNSLKDNQNENTWRTCLILQTIAQDLEIIANTHRYIASNPKMLVKEL